MSTRAAIAEIHEAIEEKRPLDTPVFIFLKEVVDSFVPKRADQITEEQAKAIVLARGAVARKELQVAEGGAIPAQQVAQILGLTRQGVDYLRKSKALVAWRATHGKWNYPVWQFAPRGILPGIKECLGRLLTDNEWGAMIFFLSERESLAGKRPLELLREGKIEQALQAAERHQQHGTY
jgi:hypothetical protein